MYRQPQIIYLSMRPVFKKGKLTKIEELKFQMELAFYEAMVNGHLTNKENRFILVLEAIKKFKIYFLRPDISKENEFHSQINGLYALINLLEIYWKLYSDELKVKDVDHHKMKMFLVHAYRSEEYVDYFLDVLFGLIIKINFALYFESAKVLRMMYLARLNALKENKSPTKRILDLNCFIQKGQIKWFALEVKSHECLWRQNEYSELCDEFQHRDGEWNLQSTLIQLKITGDCFFEILKETSTRKHCQYTKKLCQEIGDYCEDIKNSPLLVPGHKRFDKEFRKYTDLVALKGKLMDATNYEVLSLYEDNKHLRCSLLLRTIKMMLDIRRDVVNMKSEDLLYV